MGECGVELETASGQRVKGSAGAPVERQKAPCLARSCGGDFRAFHHGYVDAALAQKVGYAGADHTPAANDDPHGPLRRSCCKAALERLLLTNTTATITVPLPTLTFRPPAPVPACPAGRDQPPKPNPSFTWSL